MDDLGIKIGLIMIVKNESKIIERCLNSMISILDFVSICDTGSDDDTVDIIEKWIETSGVPGFVYCSPFIDFGTNRTISFQRGVETAEKLKFSLESTYLLTMDADQTLVCSQSERFNKNDLRDSGVIIEMRTGDTHYPNVRFMRASDNWVCKRKCHEVWHLEDTHKEATLEPGAIHIFDINDGANHPTKLQRELKLLNDDLVSDVMDARNWFYLGQTYKCMLSMRGERENAIDCYKACAALTTWNEEKWYSLYCIGLLSSPPESTSYLLQAYQLIPERLEALHALSVLHREKKEYNVAMLYAETALRSLSANPNPVKGLFVDTAVWKYKIHNEIQLIAYYVKRKELGLLCCEKLTLDLNESPVRYNAKSNLQFYIPPLGISESNVMDLGKTIDDLIPPGYYPMNPSITMHRLMETIYYMVNMRLVNYMIVDGRYVIRDEDKGCVKTKNWIIMYSEQFEYIFHKEIEINPPYPSRKSVGLEDVRIFKKSIDSKRVEFTCVSWEYSTIDGPQICLGSFSTRQLFGDNRYIRPKVRHLKSPSGNKCEKNWLPFYSPCGGGATRILYDSGPKTTILNENGTILWQRDTTKNVRDFRGSGAPVILDTLVRHKCEKWLYIIHEVLPIEGPRKYTHRFVTMDNGYNITGFSLPFYFLPDWHSRGIEYVCGFCLDSSKENLLITLGKMDHEAYLIKISLEKVLNTCSPII